MVSIPTAPDPRPLRDELALIRICRRPDDDAFEEAFEALFRRYRDRVFSIAYRMTGRTSDALDVVQESFAVLFRKIGSFREDSQFSTWLFRIVVNCCIDQRRRDQSKRVGTHRSLNRLEATTEPTDPADGPEDLAEAAELSEHVHRALGRLSDKLRAILILRYQQGLSYEELAETLEISLGTVKSRLARGHLALESVLEGTLDRYGFQTARQKPAQGDQGVA